MRLERKEPDHKAADVGSSMMDRDVSTTRGVQRPFHFFDSFTLLPLSPFKLHYRRGLADRLAAAFLTKALSIAAA